MYMEIGKECLLCRKNGAITKCSVCMSTFKRVEEFLKKKQELIKANISSCNKTI